MSKGAFIGGATLDILVTTDLFPDPDRRYVVPDIGWSIGGPALVAALTARRLSTHAVAVFSLLGVDPGAQEILTQLDAEQVPWHGVQTPHATTSTSVIVSARQHHTRTILTHRLDGTEQWVDDVIQRLTQWHPDWVHVDCYWPTITERVVAWARTHHVPLSLDLSHVEERWAAQWAVGAAVAICDTPTGNILAPTPEEAINRLWGQGVRVAGVTLGDQGCVVGEHGQYLRILPPPVTVVDTTGAGDVFHGAFVAQWMHQPDLAVAGQWATAAASLSTQTLGNAWSLLSRNAVAETVRVMIQPTTVIPKEE